MPKIEFLYGPPASGKSTYRKKRMEDPDFQPCTFTNKDSIRVKMGNKEWSSKIEKQVEQLETEAIIKACEQGLNVVVDNTHGSPRHEARYREVADRFGYEFEVIKFIAPLAELIQRDKERGEASVGEKVIRKMWRQFFKPKPAVYSPDPSLPRAIIVDLDGTLAISTNRSWYEYSKCDTDELFVPVHIVVQSLLATKQIEHVLFLTGRNEDTGREPTLRWLDSVAKFPVDEKTLHLFMKAAGDNRADVITKKETFDTKIKDNYQIVLVLEDRPRVIGLWVSLGIPVLGVNPDFEDGIW